ncbi:MAG: tRNA (guanosine(46)-N7)-methyltransferase TrmB [Candidatus Saccharimonadales bacterium]
MSFLNPQEFIITRKRKKYKFAKFHNSPLCYELDEWKKTRADVLELGAGDGLFSVQLAEKYPKKTFLAVDVKADRLQKGAYEAEKKGLTNIWFIRARADQLEQVVNTGSLENIWLTFPDPFQRTRSAKHRLTHETYLYTYTKLLQPEGFLLLKHDSRGFFLWSLEQLVACGWHISELTFDLHESKLSDDYKILTTYETRWLNEGNTINFVRATK